MKTSKIIDLLCTAISGLNDTLILVNGTYIEDEKIQHMTESRDEEGVIRSGRFETTDNYTHVHCILSPCAEMVRDLWEELPEALRDDGEENALIAKLYPHLYCEDFNLMKTVVSQSHSMIYAKWQTMSEVQSAARLYE